MKTYALTFTFAGVDLNALHTALFHDARVIDFLLVPPLATLLKSELSAVEIAARIKQFFPQGGFAVAEIVAANSCGALPEAVMQWLHQQGPSRLSRGEIVPANMGFAEMIDDCRPRVALDYLEPMGRS